MEQRPLFERASFLLAIGTILPLLVAFVMNLDMRSRYYNLLRHTTGSGITDMMDSDSIPIPTPARLELERLDRLHSRNQIMQGIVSIALLSAALFVVLSGKYTPQDKHWAYGTIGTIVGFWLGGAP